MCSDRRVKEGLAQYYTYRVCERLTGVAPCAQRAYTALLPHQPWDYHSTKFGSKRTAPKRCVWQCCKRGARSLLYCLAIHALLDGAREALHRGEESEE